MILLTVTAERLQEVAEMQARVDLARAALHAGFDVIRHDARGCVIWSRLDETVIPYNLN